MQSISGARSGVCFLFKFLMPDSSRIMLGWEEEGIWGGELRRRHGRRIAS